MARTKISAASVPGQPGFGTPKSNWPRIPRPLRRQRTLKTVIVNDVSNGLTQPEFKNLIGGDGVSSPGRGGYKGARRIFQNPLRPALGGISRIAAPRNRRIVKR